MSSSLPVDVIVLEILSDVLKEPVEDLRSEPVLAAHAWNSMASLEVLAQLEDELDITLDLRSFHAVRTVDALIDLTRTALAGAAATIPAPRSRGSVAVILGIDHVGLVTGDPGRVAEFMTVLGLRKYDEGVAGDYGVACEFWRSPGQRADHRDRFSGPG